MTDQALAMPRARPRRRIAAGVRDLLKSSGLVISSRMAGVVVGLAIQVFLARVLPLSELGIFFMAMSIAMVLSILCTAGYPMLVPRIVSDAAKAGTRSQLTEFLRRGRRDLLIASAAVSFLGLGMVIFWPGIGSTARLCLGIGVATAPFLAAMRLNGALANALRRFALGYVPDLLVRPALLAVSIIALWLLMPSLSVVAIVIVHLGIAACLALWQASRLGRAVPDETPPKDHCLPARTSDAKTRRQAGAMLVAMLFTAVVADLDLLLASANLESRETAIFGVCLKVSMLAAFAIHAVHQVIFRDTADALRDRNRPELQKVLRRANVLSCALSLCGLAGAIVLGKWVLGIFGPEFVDGYGCLVLLMTAQVARAAAGPSTQILALVGREKDCVGVFAAALALLVACNLILVPALGIIGAALAFAVAMAVWPFWLGFAVKRAIGFNPAIWSR